MSRFRSAMVLPRPQTPLFRARMKSFCAWVILVDSARAIGRKEGHVRAVGGQHLQPPPRRGIRAWAVMVTARMTPTVTRNSSAVSHRRLRMMFRLYDKSLLPLAWATPASGPSNRSPRGSCVAVPCEGDDQLFAVRRAPRARPPIAPTGAQRGPPRSPAAAAGQRTLRAMLGTDHVEPHFTTGGSQSSRTRCESPSAATTSNPTSPPGTSTRLISPSSLSVKSSAVTGSLTSTLS
jgi:hypothetical protein